MSVPTSGDVFLCYCALLGGRVRATEWSAHQDYGLKNVSSNQRTPGRRRAAPIVANYRGYALKAQCTHQPQHIAYAIEPCIWQKIIIESTGELVLRPYPRKSGAIT